MNCRDMETQAVCLLLADGTRESAVAHYEYGTDAQEIVLNASTRYTDASGEKVFDPADIKSITVGACPLKNRLITPECLVKRTIQVGYDNGVTPGSSTNDGGLRPNLVRFNENFTVLGWEVNGSQYGQGHRLENFAGWTPQLEGWAAFKQQFDPNVSTAAFAFLPAPTWRHCQLTTCDPRAIYGPIKMQRDDGVIFDVFPVPSISFASYEYAYRYTEVDCDDKKRVVWCDSKGVEIEAPEDPECFVPCGFNFGPYINSADAPDCTEVVRDLCDQTDAGPVNFVLVITDCGGKRTRERWTTESYASATDPDGLVPYDVVGQIINCETGEPYVEPPLPCDDFVVTELYSIEGKTPGLSNREWTDLGPANAFGSDEVPIEQFLETFDFSRTPDIDTVVTVNAFALNDTSNTASVLDYQVREGYICVKEPFEMEFGTSSEGYIGFWLGKCGGELQRLISYAKSVGLKRTNKITIPAGIHKVRLDNVDWGGSNSSWTPYLYVDGSPVANNRLGDDLVSTSLPYEVCKKIKVCKPGGTLIGLLTNAEIDPADCYECSIECTAACPTGDTTTAGTLRIA